MAEMTIAIRPGRKHLHFCHSYLCGLQPRHVRAA